MAALSGRVRTLDLLSEKSPARPYIALVYSPQTEQPARDLQRTLGPALNSRTQIEPVCILDASSVAEIRRTLKRLMESHSQGWRILLNYTGGTKVMAACAVRVFYEKGGRPADASYLDDGGPGGSPRLRFDNGEEHTLRGLDTLDRTSARSRRGWRVEHAGVDGGRSDWHSNVREVLPPLRPIVLGGDDMTFVADGRIALDLAVAALREFEKNQVPHLGNNGSSIHVTACAGMALVRSHAGGSRARAWEESGPGGKKGLAGARIEALDHIACERLWGVGEAAS